MTATRNENLIYDGSVTSSYNGNPILGRLEGPCADIINPTRNGRKYSDDLWKKVFDNEIVKEYFECGGIFGELGHPADRSETDMEKICICMPKPPVQGPDGRLIGQWDILNTPNGRILKCLCDYGFKMGISSRGTGDVVSDFEGNESVDPDTYQFEAFDAVLLPAVKSARLSLMKESVGNKTFTQALTESLQSATVEDRRVMTETLDRLNIDYNTRESDYTQPSEEAEGAGDAGLVADLQGALREQVELRKRISTLSEQLSACNAREQSLVEELARYKRATANLSDQARTAKAASGRVAELEKQVSERDALVESLRSKIGRLTEARQQSETQARVRLAESLERSQVQNRKLHEELTTLRQAKRDLEAKLAEREASMESDRSALTEQFESAKKDYAIKLKSLQEKLKTAEKDAGRYKKVAHQVMESYIASQALAAGVPQEDIKSRLGQKYTFEDVDRVCSELREQYFNMSRLPFAVGKKKVGVVVTESLPQVQKADEPGASDDCVDDDLLRLAKLK